MEKGETPWKLKVRVERKIRPNLVSSTRAQVTVQLGRKRTISHKVEKGVTPWKLNVQIRIKKKARLRMK